MKKWMGLILAAAISCDYRDQSKEVALPSPTEQSQWVTYEGRVPLDEDNNLYVELSMRAANESGEGNFSLEEFVESENTSVKISSFKGEYTSLYGQTPNERIVNFHNTALPEELRRSYRTPGFKGNITDSKLTMIREETFRIRDLAVKPSGKNKLIVLDNHMKAVSEESQYNLVRRLSKPFTVEGYFRHNGYSADFFEMNTGENWKVSKYGDYDKAIKQYYLLTEKKFDVTYLKGVAFPIRTDQDGGESETRVIKKVLQMTSAPGLNQE